MSGAPGQAGMSTRARRARKIDECVCHKGGGGCRAGRAAAAQEAGGRSTHLGWGTNEANLLNQSARGGAARGRDSAAPPAASGGLRGHLALVTEGEKLNEGRDGVGLRAWLRVFQSVRRA